MKTDTMFIDEDFDYFDSEELNAEFLEMKYCGKQDDQSVLTFVIVLPKERNGLKAVKDGLTATNFKSAVESMRSVNTKLYLPKFRVESEYDLTRDLEPKPLFLTKRAKFSRLTTSPQTVAEVRHKVFIEVNEKGTEAAAVTALRAVAYCLRIPPKTITLRADHPFLYFIVDRSNGIILFAGQLNKL